MLGLKLHNGTYKTKASQVGLVRVTLFWMSHCATCIPAWLILYHVTGSYKGPIVISVAIRQKLTIQKLVTLIARFLNRSLFIWSYPFWKLQFPVTQSSLEIEPLWQYHALPVENKMALTAALQTPRWQDDLWQHAHNAHALSGVPGRPTW